jgi:hypothetical protein
MRRLRTSIRRASFALGRSPWDAFDAVGAHAFFAALAAVTLFVLTLVFVGRGNAESTLLGLAAVFLAFLVFVIFKFVQAWAHPDRHRSWERLDFSGFEGLMRLELRSLAPLRPGSSRRDLKPLLCRVVAPDKSLWKSWRPALLAVESWRQWVRFYPQDFTCPKCGQAPRQIPPGEYEITWLKPWCGPIKRPLLRYTQRAATEPEQAPEPDVQAS